MEATHERRARRKDPLSCHTVMRHCRMKAGDAWWNVAEAVRSRMLPPRWGSPVPARRSGSTDTAYGELGFARIVGKRTRHQKTRPFTPRHNGNVERYQRTLAEEVLYARPYDSEDGRSAAIGVWNIHYNYHRPHSAVGGQPPATRLRTSVTNVQPSYS